MPKPKITETDLCRAAKRLGTSTAEVETVAEVESRGEPFYADGFPVILFERHWFSRLTKGKFDKSHPHISSRTAGGYGKAGQNQQNKFNEAFGLDPIAAMKSCSWGKFQIMGFNYGMCGFDNVGAFVDAMKESEGRQLEAFVRFVIGSGLADELRAHNWAGFAKGYNGAGYKKNAYDTKLAKAFEKFSKRRINCSQIDSLSAAASASNPQMTATQASSPGEHASEPDASTQPPPSTTVEHKETEAAQTPEGSKAVQTTVTTGTPKGDPPDAPATKVTENSLTSKILAGVGGIGTIATAAWGFLTSSPSTVSVGLICATVIILVILDRWKKTDVTRMDIASNPDRKNVR